MDCLYSCLDFRLPRLEYIQFCILVSSLFYVIGEVPEMFWMLLFVLCITDKYWRTQINVETHESIGQYKSGTEACHHRNGYKILIS